jgi:hypothetical protein
MMERAYNVARGLASGGCEKYSLDLLLYLETTNLRSHNSNAKRIMLCDKPTIPGCVGYMIFVNYTGDLNPQIDPGLYAKTGWKVKIQDAQVNYCRTCYTNNGLAEIVSLSAPLDHMEFINDPDNKQAIYINKKKNP